MSTEPATQTPEQTIAAQRKAGLRNALGAFGLIAGGAAMIAAGIFVGALPGGFLTLVGTITAVRGWADLSLEGGRDRLMKSVQKQGKKEGFLDKLRKRRENLPKKFDIAANVALKSFIGMATAGLVGLLVPPAAPVAFAVFKLALLSTTLSLGASEWMRGMEEGMETILGPAEKKAEAPVEKTAAPVAEAPVAKVASPAAGFEKAAAVEKPAAELHEKPVAEAPAEVKASVIDAPKVPV